MVTMFHLCCPAVPCDKVVLDVGAPSLAVNSVVNNGTGESAAVVIVDAPELGKRIVLHRLTVQQITDANLEIVFKQGTGGAEDVVFGPVTLTPRAVYTFEFWNDVKLRNNAPLYMQCANGTLATVLFEGYQAQV